MGASSISPSFTPMRHQRHKMMRSRKAHSHDPTVHLHIGPLNPPTYLATHQSLLTSASNALHRHLRAQVPDPAEYRTRDKTMKMKNELPSTVARFLDFIEHRNYDAGDQPIREHLRLCVFASKYEVPALAKYARHKAGGLLQGMLAEVMDVDDGDSSGERKGEGRGGEKAREKICAEVLWGVEEEERRVLRDVLGRLVTPFVWKASGDW